MPNLSRRYCRACQYGTCRKPVASTAGPGLALLPITFALLKKGVIALRFDRVATQRTQFGVASADLCLAFRKHQKASTHSSQQRFAQFQKQKLQKRNLSRDFLLNSKTKMKLSSNAIDAVKANEFNILRTPIGGLRETHAIMGRGGRGNNRYANKKYRKIVESFRPRYLDATSLKEKEAITKETLEAIKPIQFVKEVEGDFFLVTPKEAYRKTGQYLRDGRPKDQRKKLPKKTKKTTAKRQPQIKETFAPMTARTKTSAGPSAPLTKDDLAFFEPINVNMTEPEREIDVDLLNYFFDIDPCDTLLVELTQELETLELTAEESESY
ncbi:expressed unknown protein [Seminavis robusta]|uniref:DUF6824 domain-containing protein n=1 Tax=Seminavis robusta TaxID=568900 RepID=A0A9N8HJX4_9STRA|nr:expressed unknown protein [Seminavis robusta]|eukprot:Sro717_g192010.1 n/a (325) ;mRNA; r:25246-26220